MSTSSTSGFLARRLRLAGTLAVVLAAAALTPDAAPAQSAGDILQEALDRYEERAQGIDNYTVVQEVMGNQVTTRFVKQEVDGRMVFVPAGSAPGGQQMNPYEMVAKAKERARVEGTETVGGTETRVLAVDDLEGLGITPDLPSEEATSDFTPRFLTLWMDTDEYLVHRMRLVGTIQGEGGPQEITFTANLGDYRQIEGFYHPFRIDARMEGLAATLTPEQRQKLQQLQEQLKSMPPAQREQMEKMLGPQLEALSGGGMEFTITVQDFQVNTPPPGGSGS